MPNPIAYAAAARPDVEVLYDGTWSPGEVRMVKWLDDVELRQVQYRRPVELSSHLDDFTAEQIRASTADYARGHLLAGA